MFTSSPFHELPVLREIDNTTNQVSLGDDLRLSVIEGTATPLPDYFQTAVYALNLHVRGHITANINHLSYDIKAPCFSSILINQPIKVIGASEDHLQYVLSFSPQFGEDLHLNLSGDAHIRAYMRPVFPLTEQQMRVILHYFDLLGEVIQMPDGNNTREVALDLVRSMAYFVYGLYDKSFSSLYTISRPEELTGKFLALVERHCAEHHSIDWYANEMCLAPKYIANVVKQVTGRSAGECITYNLIRQAKLLLLTTSLPVQQISDRLGFRNQSHFGTFFRREVGMSPRAFRGKL
ncbi:MAG: helix-turn-helix domain-containing protein [Bacteroidales bacterium]|nr:helix-turn-helix domain-containing protein [Bacteroidales bacterium]